MERADSSSRGHGVASAPQDDAVPDTPGEQGREDGTVPTAPDRVSEEHVRRLVDAAPPLTVAQQVRLAALLRAYRSTLGGERAPP